MEDSEEGQMGQHVEQPQEGRGRKEEEKEELVKRADQRGH